MATKNIKPKYYITTPIYFPSGKWHLGHSYTTVCCDALARFNRLEGKEVFYLTGTDEHGQKIEENAKKAGKSPQEFVDELVASIKELWKLFNIEYDGFIRTTDKNHEIAVQDIFNRLKNQGDIYKSTYSGFYCTPCESFWTNTQAKGKKCPDCNREVQVSQEECYFFRLSKYRDRLLKLLTEENFLEPKSRVNEMVNNFIKSEGGLEDLAVSRTSFSWGVPVKEDEQHVIYVWIDALSNYITALGYKADKSLEEQNELFKKFWPADLHLMAKEIVRFHALIWPAVLMALELPLPKKIYGHGWLLFDGDKMSKSKGNVVDPFILCERYGVDAMRFCLLREISFGQDCDYSTENFLMRINSDLCNDLGNLTKRTMAMSRQYFEGKVSKPKKDEGTEFDGDLIKKINGLYGIVKERLDKLEISKALESIFDVISASNKYIDNTTPWVLNKEETKEAKTKLNAVIYNLLEVIRVCSNMLLPFMPNTPSIVYKQLGLELPANFNNAKYGVIKQYNTTEGDALFLRLDIKKELGELANL